MKKSMASSGNQDPKIVLQEALAALYNHQNAQVRMDANAWLQNFQQTMEAWQVSDSLLHDPNSSPEILIFCSQTLKSKVQHDFESLPIESFPSLRDSLKNLAKKFGKGPSRVRTQIENKNPNQYALFNKNFCEEVLFTQISIAIAALIVHVPGEKWGDGGPVQWIQNEFGNSREFLPCLLELLMVLPEEASNLKIAARPERKRQFQRELKNQVEIAFNILTSCLAVEDLHEQILDAFASWVGLCTSIPSAALASHPLVQVALNALNSDELFDAASDVACELIRYSACGASDVAEHMPLIQVLVPRVMSLRPRFTAFIKHLEANNTEGMHQNSGEEEIVKCIARLFAEIGEAYVELIATGSTESMMIVEAILEATSHPDFDISTMTYNFWHELQDTLTGRGYYTQFPNDTAMDAEKKRRIEIFSPAFHALVSLISTRVAYPEKFSDWSSEGSMNFKRLRFVIGDLLARSAFVLGGEVVLKSLSENLFQAANTAVDTETWDWRPLECSLFCIRAIGPAVPTSEATIMPQVMQLLPKLPSQPQILETACMTIGKYAKWLSQAPSASTFLPSLIDFILKSLSEGKDASKIAPMVLRNVCDACSNRLGGLLDHLFSIYQKGVSGDNSSKLSTKNAFKLIEALSMLVNTLPTENATKALESLCIPIVSYLEQVISQQTHSFGLGQFPGDPYATPIDQLSNIFRFIKNREAVLNAFRKAWPTIKKLIAQRTWDMDTMERLCRACKYAVRTCKKSLAAMIGDILQQLQVHYKLHNQSCFLYLSSEIIKIFGSDPSCANLIGNLIIDLFDHTMKNLKSIEEFTSRPELADDCFLLASRCFRYCSDLLINSPVFAPLVNCAMTGITIQHREASQSILSFLADIFEMVHSGATEYKASIDNVIVVRGGNITRLLMACLLGALPDAVTIEISYVISGLIKAYGSHVMKWLQQTFSLIPASVLTDDEKSTILQILSLAADGMDVADLACHLEDLSEICRRNKAVRDLVQSALKPQDISFSENF